MRGIFNCTVEMGSGAVKYLPSFIKIGAGIQKLMGVGGHRHTDSKVILKAYIYFFKMRKVC
jgi:hypothetical protein